MDGSDLSRSEDHSCEDPGSGDPSSEEHCHVLAAALREIDRFRPRGMRQRLFRGRLAEVAGQLERLYYVHRDDTLSAEILYTLMRFVPRLLGRDESGDLDAELPPAARSEEADALATVETVRDLLATFDPPGDAAAWYGLLLRVHVDCVELCLSLDLPESVPDVRSYLDDVAGTLRSRARSRRRLSALAA